MEDIGIGDLVFIENEVMLCIGMDENERHFHNALGEFVYYDDLDFPHIKLTSFAQLQSDISISQLDKYQFDIEKYNERYKDI